MNKFLPILRLNPLFQGLSDEEILTSLNCINARLISKPCGSYIFNAGDYTDSMGLVLSGSVLITQVDIWTHRNIMSKCYPGDYFGEPFAAKPGTILNRLFIRMCGIENRLKAA